VGKAVALPFATVDKEDAVGGTTVWGVEVINLHFEVMLTSPGFFKVFMKAPQF
jgi:hypothetical protein